MKIPELFKDGHTVFSFEVFPPKKDNDVSVIYDTLEQLGDLHPDRPRKENKGTLPH